MLVFDGLANKVLFLAGLADKAGHHDADSADEPSAGSAGSAIARPDRVCGWNVLGQSIVFVFVNSLTAAYTASKVINSARNEDRHGKHGEGQAVLP